MKNSNKLIFLTLNLLAVVSMKLNAQTNFWNSSDAYLGQTPPSDTPKMFAPGRLADAGAFAMDRVAFSPDGKEFYYCQNTKWYDTDNLKIKCFKFANGRWNGPSILSEHFYAPTFSVDGQTLYFMVSGGIQIWQSHRIGDGWSNPELYLENKCGVYDFIPTESGNCYVGGDPEQKPNTSYFCTLTISNTGSAVKSLGTPLNEPGFNGDFFVAKDESYMIISTKETKDFECELDISFRKPDKTWTNPKSLGPLINNGMAHRWGEYVTPDGKYLFYCHGTSEKDCAIYWVRFDKLLQRLKNDPQG